MPAAPLPPDEVPRRESPVPASFSVSELIEEVTAAITVRAGEKGLTLRRFLADDVPAFLAGDAEPLRRVLATLLDNALQFTGAGQVRLDIRTESDPEEGPPDTGILLRVTVIDSGIGIERDARASVFEGPSLAVARHIVQLMGGDIQVYSVPGEGATFWFTARFVPADAARTPPPPLQHPPSRPLRILIAEDNVVNQLVLAEQLKTLGHTSLVVSNGREALDAIESSPPWDAVLIDCQMPVMDGYEAVAVIRRREAAGAARVWVVAVTANAFEGNREDCLRAGMDDFLPKPFHLRQLIEVITRIPPPIDDLREPVDLSKLDALGNAGTSGRENRLVKMVRLFTESGREILDQMEAALGEEDFVCIVRLAHKLAGGCSYLGAQDLHRLCADAQRLGRVGDHGGLRLIVPRIRQEYARVEQALRRASPSKRIDD